MDQIKVFIKDFKDVPKLATSKLNSEHIMQLKEIQQLSDKWQFNPSMTVIKREFEFPTFKESFAFMSSVSDLSEKMEHYPKWYCFIFLNQNFLSHISNQFKQAQINLILVFQLKNQNKSQNLISSKILERENQIINQQYNKGSKVIVEITTPEVGLTIKDILLAYTMDNIQHDILNDEIQFISQQSKLTTQSTTLLNCWNKNYSRYEEEILPQLQRNVNQF